MFFYLRKNDVLYENADHLTHPKEPMKKMYLAFYTTEGGTAFFKSWHKKVLPEYREVDSHKIIPKRRWTPQMHEFVNQKIKTVPPQKSRHKLTIVGWIFLAIVVGFFAFFLLDKPDNPQIVFNNLDESVQAGDVYFGHFQEFNEQGSKVLRDGYAWFKVKNFENDTAYIQLGKEFTDSNFKADSISSSHFEEKIYHTTIREQKDYSIDFRTENSQMMFTAGRKKEK